jgi:hypothetical protein
MNQIFVCYRREDAEDVAGRIFDRLEERFGRNHVFKDNDTLRSGENFPATINGVIEKCRVVLVLIGKAWFRLFNERNDPHQGHPDYVRIEIETALRQSDERDLLVIPVVLSGLPSRTPVPPATQGPIDRLLLLTGAVVRPDPDFNGDMDRLLDRIQDETHVRVAGRSLNHDEVSVLLKRILDRADADVDFCVSIGPGDFASAFLARYVAQRRSLGVRPRIERISIRHLHTGRARKLIRMGLLDKDFVARMEGNIRSFERNADIKYFNIEIAASAWPEYPPFHGYLIGEHFIMGEWTLGASGQLHVNTAMTYYRIGRTLDEIPDPRQHFEVPARRGYRWF